MSENNEKLCVYRGNTKPCEILLSDLKKEISKYMQSDNLNFLMGAGCSSHKSNGKEVGIPIMSGLYEEFKEENPEFSICGKKIFEDDNVSNLLNNNLEELMEKLISLRDIKDYVSDDLNNINDNILLVKEFINNKIKNNINSSEVLKTYKEFYLRTIRKNKKNPINIATTNYDLFNEIALDNLGFYYNDGFSGTFERKFNPLTYNYIYANNMNLKNNTWNRVDNYFNLFKIHGSISWSKDDDGQIYEKDPKYINNNVMIYPTPLKDRSTLMVPYSDLFRSFENQLSKPNSVLITLGYSFGDDHINRIILNNLASTSFRLIVLGKIGSKNSTLNKILQNNDPRITVINSKDKIQYFENFVNKLMPSPLDDVNDEQKIKDMSDKLFSAIYKDVDDEK